MAKITQIVGTNNIGDDFPKINAAMQSVETDLTITGNGNVGTELSVDQSQINTSLINNDAGFIASAPVDSVAGKTGVVTLDKTDVGLSNVDNTSDASKPISTATQTALDGKLDDVVAGTNITIDKTDPLNPIISSTGSGAGAFTDLSDTPADYTGAASKVVQVNAGATALEFVTLAGGGDMLASTYDPNTVAADAFDMDNMAEGTTNKILTSAERTILSNTSGVNSGDQTSIVGITGTTLEFNTALTDADFATGGGTASGTNTGDQTTIAGITGTKAEFDTAVTDDNFAYIGTDNNFTVNQTFGVDVTITGDLTVNGDTTTINTQTVEVEDNLLLINNGETGAGVTAGSAGIEIDRGTETNYEFKFVESDDSFKIGEVGSLQSVATREDTPTDTGIAYFNTATSKFETSSNNTIDSGNFKGTTSINNQTGTAYTLVLGDRSSIIEMSNAAANTATIPANSAVAFPIGTTLVVMQLDAGITTVQGDTGVTVNGVSAGSKATAAQYEGVSLYKRGTDEWVIINK